MTTAEALAPPAPPDPFRLDLLGLSAGDEPMTLVIPPGLNLRPGAARPLLEAGYILSWTTDPWYDDDRGAGTWPARGGVFWA